MEKRLKILEVNTETTWRGGERQTWYALKGFRALHQEVELLARTNAPLAEKAKQEGYVCHEVTQHMGVVPFLIQHGKRYDVIHVQTASLLTFAVLTKPFHNSKVVHTRRLDFVPKGILTRWKYKQADLIVYISTPIKDILKKFGIGKQVLIPECVEAKNLNLERGQQLLQHRGWKGKKIIGTTAALVQHKDPQTLVKTIEQLVQLREDFVLLHFGEGPLRPEIEKMIADRHLKSHYHLMGFQQNVEDFFSIFDVFVMSSEEEGLGSSVLDAFIYKVPVVSTNAGGLAEIVAGRGLLVDKKNPKALADALDEALSYPHHLAPLVQAAFDYATNELTIEQVHTKYVEAFSKLTSASS